MIGHLWDDGLAEETATRAESDMYAARFRRQTKNSWFVSRLNLNVDINAPTNRREVEKVVQLVCSSDGMRSLVFAMFALRKRRPG